MSAWACTDREFPLLAYLDLHGVSWLEIPKQCRGFQPGDPFEVARKV